VFINERSEGSAHQIVESKTARKNAAEGRERIRRIFLRIFLRMLERDAQKRAARPSQGTVRRRKKI